MDEVPKIIDRGRGMQLSTCRITVQDIVPYLALSNDQIREIMPILRDDEINAIRRYVAEHFESVMAQDRMIRARSEAEHNSPEAIREREERRQRMADRRAAHAR